jgi:predicted Zn-dependent protease
MRLMRARWSVVWLVVLGPAACSGGGMGSPRPGRAPTPVAAAPSHGARAAPDRAMGDSAEAAALLDRGMAELRSGGDSSAARDFSRALRMEPRLTTALVGLALIEARAGRFPASLTLADSAAALGDTSPLVRNLRGRMLAELRRCPEAAAVLAPFARAHPEWTQPTPELARCLLSLHREGEAVSVMQEAVRREPNAAPLQYALVDAFTASTQLDSALAHARALTGRQPEDGLWWVVTGRVLLLAGRSEEARAAFEKGFRLQPGLVDRLAPIDRSAWQALQGLPGRPPR